MEYTNGKGLIVGLVIIVLIMLVVDYYTHSGLFAGDSKEGFYGYPYGGYGRGYNRYPYGGYGRGYNRYSYYGYPYGYPWYSYLNPYSYWY